VQVLVAEGVFLDGADAASAYGLMPEKKWSGSPKAPKSMV